MVAAKDEQDNIEACVTSLLAQDYPSDRIEFLICSDGSTDRSDELLAENLRALGFVRALADGKVLVTTLDNSYRKPDAVDVDVFGLPKAFGPWAARIAAKRRVPMLPCYPRSENGRVEVWTGDPRIDSDPRVLMENYVGFFERCILRDPGSWAFLGDKRWGQHLKEAVAAVPLAVPVLSSVG